MYAIAKKGLHPIVKQYILQPCINSIAFDEQLQAYVYSRGKRGGLTKALKRLYYPRYSRKRKTQVRASKRRRKASSIAQGQQIDYELQLYVATGKYPDDEMAKAVCYYLEQHMEHHIQAVQLPLLVMVNKKERITQADVITMDMKGQLWMWEIKSGWNQAQSQGYLQHLRYPKVLNKDHEHWELQRHYTQEGLRHCGLPIHRSHVLNVYFQDDQVAVERRPAANWCKQIKVGAVRL